MSISGPINGTTESASYSYDVLGRLVTSNQTSNGSNAQRRFAYDRWGNRTGVWDAVSGGTQIQSVVLQQSGGAPTNRLTSVTTSGVPANYSYDAAGNVTNDGLHVYTYDAENRIVSVDGGATASYSYDMSNRRFKKVSGGATTHYVWQASQAIAEHNGSTGAVITDYVYFGSRMIANVSGGSTQYLLSDRLSVRVALDGSGNVLGRQAHFPFGEDFGESGTQEKHHFTSYERDASNGLDYAINRWYSANVGRFISADPYKSSGYAQDPRSWNRYSYTRNVLTNRIDPLGLDDVGASSCYVFLGHVICPGLGGSIDVNAGADGAAAIGIGGGGQPKPPPNLDGTGNGVGGVGQRISDLWDKFWNELNKCEKQVALAHPLAFQAVSDARSAAEEAESDLRGGKPGDDDYPNAVKHCVWSCIMTIKLDFSTARAFGDAHESNPKDHCNLYTDPSSLMDQHNNDVGRTIGYNLGFSGSPKECIKRCKASGDLQREP